MDTKQSIELAVFVVATSGPVAAPIAFCSPRCASSGTHPWRSMNSLPKSAANSFWRETPIFSNTRFRTVRTVFSEMPRVSAAFPGDTPAPISAANRASPNVNWNTSRTTAGSNGRPCPVSTTRTIVLAV